MASAASHASFLPPVLVFCTAAVVGVPIFRSIGLSAVLGYLAAGLVIGPSGLSLIADPETALGVSELGVVLLLFIVGLELKLSRLLSMRRDIFGLGLGQLALTAVVFGAAGLALGLSTAGATVVGLGLALSATSIALQLLEERGDLQAAYGQRAFAVLLFQDLSIVPILAILPLLATAGATESAFGVATLFAAGKAFLAVIAVILIGRYGLNPLFRLLAHTGAREVMAAAALLIVLGTALLMERVGLSMAMGAFLAGVLLAESNFRHQLEADIEPFRGILLGLFFMSVGMSIDLALVRDYALLLALATPAVVLAKVLLVTLLMRFTGSDWRASLRAGVVLSMAGEFTFVMLPAAAGLGLLSGTQAQLATALAALTMLLGPVLAKLIEMALARYRPTQAYESDAFAEGGGEVLVIGCGRFGQVVNQALLAESVDVTVIDKDIEQIRSAARFGFRVYYGDGTRLDVLRAAGAERARVICVCIEDPEAALKIAEILHQEFPHARTYVRAYDRIHAIELMKLDVDYQLRETFESALAFGRATLEALGVEAEHAAEVIADVRRRDIARLMMQKAEGFMGGADLLHGAVIAPEPLTAPKSKPRALSPATRDALGEGALP